MLGVMMAVWRDVFFFLDYGWNILGPRRMLCSLSVSHFIKMSAGFWRDLIILQVLCFLQSTRWMSKGKIYPKSPNTYMSHYDDTVVRSWDADSEPNRSLLQTVLIQFWIFLCTVYQHWTVFLKDTCLKMSVNADVCEFEISREPMSESLYTQTGLQMIVFIKNELVFKPAVRLFWSQLVAELVNLMRFHFGLVSLHAETKQIEMQQEDPTNQKLKK